MDMHLNRLASYNVDVLFVRMDDRRDCMKLPSNVGLTDSDGYLGSPRENNCFANCIACVGDRNHQGVNKSIGC